MIALSFDGSTTAGKFSVFVDVDNLDFFFILLDLSRYAVHEIDTYTIEQQVHEGRVKNFLDFLSLPVVAKGTTGVNGSSGNGLGSDILSFGYRRHASWSGSAIKAL